MPPITTFPAPPEPGNVYWCDALSLLRAMPDASVDITITSPPYNLGADHRRGGGFATEKGLHRKLRDSWYDGGENMPEPEYQSWINQIVGECLRVSKGLVWINHKTRFRDGVGIHPLSFLNYPLYSEIIWSRPGSFMLNSRRFAQSHEYIFGFGTPHYWDDSQNSACTVWKIPAVQNSEHACPYPETLIVPLILASCPVDGVVFDPFFGSGTTGIVSRRLNRRWLGCDITEPYVELARRRLAAPYTLPMFEQSAP